MALASIVALLVGDDDDDGEKDDDANAVPGDLKTIAGAITLRMAQCFFCLGVALTLVGRNGTFPLSK